MVLSVVVEGRVVQLPFVVVVTSPHSLELYRWVSLVAVVAYA